MMKKILICLGLALIPFYAAAVTDQCRSNIENEDMCVHAKQIAKQIKKGRPIESDDLVNIIDVKSEGKRIIVTTEMNTTRDSLENTYKRKGVSLVDGTTMLRANATEVACGSKLLTAFVNLGGVMQYEFVFSDGSLFDIVAVTSCK